MGNYVTLKPPNLGKNLIVDSTGSCFDNAAAESFFAVLKAEIGTTV
ncbi:hypothetical protein [Streptomyces zaomyceticus]